MNVLDNNLSRDEILSEIERLQIENKLNDKKIQYLMSILLSNTNYLKSEDKVDRTLSYKLGNLLINTPKNYEGAKKIVKGIVSIRNEALLRREKRGQELNTLDKAFLNVLGSIQKPKQIELLNNSTLDIKANVEAISSKKIFKNLEYNQVKILNNTSEALYIGTLPKGIYEFSISYKSELLSKNRKCLYIGFGNNKSAEISKATGLSISEKAGPYFYIGSGIFDEEKSVYIQTFKLNVSSSLDELVCQIFASIDSVIIEKLIIQQYIEQKIPKNTNDIKTVKNINDCLNSHFIKNINVDFILYADINVNVVDGSSVWFSSMATVLSSIGRLAIVLKETPRHQQIISNIKGKFSPIYIDPISLGYDGVFTIDDSIKIIKTIDHYSPQLKLVVVRGIDVAFSLHADNQFLGRTASYVTDFYSIDENGLLINEQKLSKLKLIAEKTEYLLTQTEEIRQKILDLTSSKAKLISFVPTLPKNSNYFFSKKEAIKNEVIKIGYAGKITPNWGVLELFEWVEQIQQEVDIKIELHIASNKISSPTNAKKFRHLIHESMKNLNVHYYNDYNREECMQMLSSMDFVWCWRPSTLEDNTLELSTKLMEAAVIGARTMNYPSKINQKFLGKNYPFYLKDYASFKSLVCERGIAKYDGFDLSKKVLDKHAINNHILEFEKEFTLEGVQTSNKKILFASHDFKFIDPFISNLKKKGFLIKKQVWEWGGHKNETELKENYEWADLIFCEWGLANAVWYSKNNIDKKPLYIRMHAQEIRDRARKFGNQIVWDNITSVIFVSNEIKMQAQQLWPSMPINKIGKIPNFILDDKLTYNNKKFNDINEIKLGILGIVPQTKRLDRAINLLEQLRIKGVNAKLYVKGYRPEQLEFMHAPSRKHELDYYYNLYSEIEKKELTDYIVFEGWGNNVNEWYQKIHFILSSSDNESFHYALADGIVTGCYPIVWNWKSSNESYPFILNKVDTEKDAIDIILKTVNRDPKEISKEVTNFRKALLRSNASKVVYSSLLNLLHLN